MPAVHVYPSNLHSLSSQELPDAALRKLAWEHGLVRVKHDGVAVELVNTTRWPLHVTLSPDTLIKVPGDWSRNRGVIPAGETRIITTKKISSAVETVIGTMELDVGLPQRIPVGRAGRPVIIIDRTGPHSWFWLINFILGLIALLGLFGIRKSRR